MDANQQKALWAGHMHSGTYGEFFVMEHRLAPGHRLPRHTHDTPGLAVMLRGDYRGTTRRSDHECYAGEVILVPQGVGHSEEIGRHGARGLLVFPNDCWLTREDPGGQVFDRFAGYGGVEIQRISRDLDREAQWERPADPLLIEGLLAELLAVIRGTPVRPSRRAPARWLRSAYELLHDRYAEPLPLAEVAACVGISRSQLARGFRAEFGCSVGEFLRRRRLEAAASLLRLSSKPLAEVAVETGFFDQSHLTRIFKERFRTTPRGYREAWR